MSQRGGVEENSKTNKRKALNTLTPLELDNENIYDCSSTNFYDRIEDDKRHASKLVDFNSEAHYYDARGGFRSAIEIYWELCKKIPVIKEKINRAGWGLFFNIRAENVSHVLVEALVERWWDTTHTFHFPFGEMGITPFDWSMLTGIDIGTGGLVPYNPSKYTFAYIKSNIFPELDAKGWGSDALTLAFLKSYFKSSYLINAANNPALIDRVVRAYFMFFLGQVLFSNAKNNVQVGWLAAFEDLSAVGEYDWGGAALAYLYMSLNSASRRSNKSLNGAWQVLEFWCYEYLGVCEPNLEQGEGSEDIQPRAARWNLRLTNKITAGKNNFNLPVARNLIEGLTAATINWSPWATCSIASNKERVQRAYDISFHRMMFLCYEDSGVWYLGDRCWRQLDNNYALPGNPIKPMSGISKHEWEKWVELGWPKALQYIQIVQHDVYDKYWADVRTHGSGNIAKVDWNVRVYGASGDCYTIAIPSAAKHATVLPSQHLSYNRLYQLYQETTDLVAQMRSLILEKTKDLADVIAERDTQLAAYRAVAENQTTSIEQLQLRLTQSSQSGLVAGSSEFMHAEASQYWNMNIANPATEEES